MSLRAGAVLVCYISLWVCWQVMHLEDYEDGATFSNLNDGPYPLVISLILLVLDSIFYLLVAVYLDQVIPGMFMRRTELCQCHQFPKC